MNRKIPHIEKQVCPRLRTMKNFIISRTDSAQAAEDIYAVACVTIWRKIRNGEFKLGSGTIDTFMWFSAKVAIKDYYRRENKYDDFTRNEYAHYHSVFARNLNFEREYELAVENRRFIKEAMKKLSAVCRKVLILFLFQNMKLYEIDETLDMPSATASNYLREMRSRFGFNFCRTKIRKIGRSNG